MTAPDTTSVVTCGQCGEVLDENPSLVQKPPCPYCGSTRRGIDVTLTDRVHVYGEMTLMRVREYGRRDPVWLLATAGVAVAAAAVGTWVLTSWAAFVVSLALAVLGFFVGLRGTWRVVEQENIGTRR